MAETNPDLVPAGAPVTRRARWWLVAALTVLVLAAGLIVLSLLPVGQFFHNRELLVDYVRRQGAWGPVIMMALQAVHVIVVPLPGQLLSLASGFLFGVWRGTLFSALGTAVGTGCLLVLGRLFGRPLLAKLVSVRMLESADCWAEQKGVFFFFMIILLPFLPDDIACLAMALSSVPLLFLFALILIGRIPGQIAASWIGARAAGVPPWAWFVGAAVVVFVIGVAWIYRAQIEARLFSAIDGCTGHRER